MSSNGNYEATSDRLTGPYYLPDDTRYVPSPRIIIPFEKVDSVLSFNALSYLLTNVGTFLYDVINWVGAILFFLGLVIYYTCVVQKIGEWKSQSIPVQTTRPEREPEGRASNAPPNWSI